VASKNYYSPPEEMIRTGIALFNYEIFNKSVIKLNPFYKLIFIETKNVFTRILKKLTVVKKIFKVLIFSWI